LFGAVDAINSYGYLVVAGGNDGSGAISSVEVGYIDDLLGGYPWIAATDLGTARYWEDLVPLANGTVMAIGGLDSSGAPLATTEIYDMSPPWAGNWSAGGGLSAARVLPAVARLADGRVLIAGGTDGSVVFSSVDIVEP
jgi:hypothetical protein